MILEDSASSLHIPRRVPDRPEMGQALPPGTITMTKVMNIPAIIPAMVGSIPVPTHVTE